MNLQLFFQRLQARAYYFRGNLHRYWGNIYGDRTEYETAVDDYTRALTLDPTFSWAYFNRGVIFWRELDHPRKAIQDLTQAESLNPRLIEARFNRGIAYQLLREYAQAVADFQAYLMHGRHPYWREYAQKMVQELAEWLPQS